MNERRQHSRYQATTLLEVFEQHSGRYLGRVADISSDGLMLCCPTHQPADTLVECQLVCSTPLNGVNEVRFIGDCLWSRDGEPGQQCWSGYHIIDIDQPNTEAFNALLRHFQASS